MIRGGVCVCITFRFYQAANWLRGKGSTCFKLLGERKNPNTLFCILQSSCIIMEMMTFVPAKTQLHFTLLRNLKSDYKEICLFSVCFVQFLKHLDSSQTRKQVFDAM